MKETRWVAFLVGMGVARREWCQAIEEDVCTGLRHCPIQLNDWRAGDRATGRRSGWRGTIARRFGVLAQ